MNGYTQDWVFGQSSKAKYRITDTTNFEAIAGGSLGGCQPQQRIRYSYSVKSQGKSCLSMIPSPCMTVAQG